MGFLQEVEAGGAITEVCRRHGVSQNTFLRWRHQYGGLPANETQQQHALEEENRRLRRLVADQALNLQVVRDLLGRKW